MDQNTIATADQEGLERKRLLEEKKRKIEELRRKKQSNVENERREKEIRRNRDSTPTNRPPTMTTQELHNLMVDAGIKPPEIIDPSLFSVNNEDIPNKGDQNTCMLNNGSSQFQYSYQKKKPKHLEIVSSINTINIPPRNEAILYCKTTQTDERISIADEFSTGSQEDMVFDDEISIDEMVHMSELTIDQSPNHEVRKHLKRLHFNPQHSHLDQTLTDQLASQKQSQSLKVPELSDEERRKIMNSAEFTRFFEKSTRVIERALVEEGDIFVDYVNGQSMESEKQIDQGELLVLNREIFEPNGKFATTNRGVRAISFSALYPELVAVSYDRSSGSPFGSESIIHLWNCLFKTSPEMTFQSSSRITSIIFDQFRTNIIIGGCYSGQICVWDIRANKRTPVLKTPLSQNAHTQPVYCMQMVGTTNAHDLVTVSTDGRLCSWSVDNLQLPIEAMNLTLAKNKRTITATSMSFFDNNINNFIIGSEEGEIYLADRHGTKGEIQRSVEAHQMPITNVDLHTGHGSVDFSPLCLSSSMDFGLKLWNFKDISLTTPLLSLERKHRFYITDVKWSPTHPAVFASTSADGTLSIWNLNTNTEGPLTTLQHQSASKVRWNRNGQQLVVGDQNGRIYLYNVHETLCMARATEWDDFAGVIKELNANAMTQQQQQAQAIVDAAAGT